MSPVVTRGLAQRTTLEDPELMRTLAEQAAEDLADAFKFKGRGDR